MTDPLDGIAAVLLFGEFRVSPGLTILTMQPAATGVEDHDLVYPDEAEPAARA